MAIMKSALLFVLGISLVNCIPSERHVSLTLETSSSNPVTISCNYDGLVDQDNLTWKYLNSTGVVSVMSANALTINLTSLTEVGVYTCNIDNIDVEVITVAYLSPPTIQNIKKSVTFNDGDTKRKLTCISEGSYPPAEFQWRRRNEDAAVDLSVAINPLDPNINITETAESSTILFQNLTYSMQAYYECHVNNSAGNSTVEVLIRVKDRLAALWPFLGIVAEVVVLIALIFLFEQRSKKTSQVTVPDIKDDLEVPLKDKDSGTELRNRVPNNNYK